MKYCYSCMGTNEDDANNCRYCGKDFGTKRISPHLLPPGTRLANRYVLGNVIGEGGFGITYVGMDERLIKKVAIKEYFPSGLVTRTADKSISENISASGQITYKNGKEKFLQEAQILAGFAQEPAIVSVSDYFEENNTAYIVMDYLEGENLNEFLKRRGSISPEEAVSLLKPIAESLIKVHSTGLIHRDISPDNIIITQNGVKLLDFGAARYYSTADERSLSVILKLGYAPEEQYRRKGEQGPWTDVYALCATFYRCITGEKPEEAIQRMLEDRTLAPSQKGIVIPTNIENAIMHGLAVFRKDRTQSMTQLLAELSAEPVPLNTSHVSPQNNSSANEIVEEPKKANSLKWIIPVFSLLIVALVGIFIVVKVVNDKRSNSIQEDINSKAEEIAEIQDTDTQGSDKELLADETTETDEADDINPNLVRSYFAQGCYMEVAEDHSVEYGFSGDLSTLFQELAGIDVDCDGREDHFIYSCDEENNLIKIEAQFGNGDSFTYHGELQPGANMLQISFGDINKDNNNELLILNGAYSTKGPLTSDIALYAKNGSWNRVDVRDIENHLLASNNVRNIVFDTKLSDYNVYTGRTYSILDARLTDSGIQVLYDFADKWSYDLFAVSYELNEDILVLKDISREAIEKAWPEDFADEGMQVQAFIKYDEILTAQIPMFEDDDSIYLTSSNYGKDTMGQDSIHYALLDLDGDYKMELFVWLWGYFGYYAKWNGEKLITNIGPYGSSGTTILCRDDVGNNYLVFVDKSHAGRETYDVSKYTETGNVSEIIGLQHWYGDDGFNTGQDEYYKSVEGEEAVTITKDEYDSLMKQYVPTTEYEWDTIKWSK